MVDKQNILSIVQAKGPIIPNELKKELKAGDTIMLGALLSELAEEGKVKVTHTKVGGTPAYYTLGTEVRLQNLLKYLNSKDKNTAEMLRQKKILKDSDQEPLVRVSLRSIKDFAKPLEVTVKGKKEIYWKWYTVPSNQAQEIILKQVKLAEKTAKKEEPAPAKKPEEKQEQEKQEGKKGKQEKKKTEEEIKAEKKQAEAKEPAEKPEKTGKEIQQELGIDLEALEKEKDPFFKKIFAYCKEYDIMIKEYGILRKKSDIELFLVVPSRIGSQEYYCKAKSKKKVNDGDLSSAYIHGQAKKLPVIFLTRGELTKKAKEMLSKDFKGMIVKKI